MANAKRQALNYTASVMVVMGGIGWNQKVLMGVATVIAILALTVRQKESAMSQQSQQMDSAHQHNEREKKAVSTFQVVVIVAAITIAAAVVVGGYIFLRAINRGDTVYQAAAKLTLAAFGGY